MPKEYTEILGCRLCNDAFQVIIGHPNCEQDMADHMKVNHPGKSPVWNISQQYVGPERATEPVDAKGPGALKGGPVSGKL